MEKEKKQFNKIAEKYGLKLLLLFGSQVNKKNLHQESDFDIAYLAERELKGREQIDLNCDLMDIFHSDKIDMVNLKNVDPLLRYEIAINSELLYGDGLDYLESNAFAFRTYIDSQRLFDLEDILVEKRHKLLEQSIYGK